MFLPNASSYEFFNCTLGDCVVSVGGNGAVYFGSTLGDSVGGLCSVCAVIGSALSNCELTPAFSQLTAALEH